MTLFNQKNACHGRVPGGKKNDTDLNLSNNYKGLFKGIFPKTVSVTKRKIPLL